MNHEHKDFGEEQQATTQPISTDATPASTDRPVQPELSTRDTELSGLDGAEPDPINAIQQAIERDPYFKEALIERLITTGSLQMSRTEDYSGLIPHPDHWDRFDDQTRERMLRMSEASTSDESARRDRALEATISETTAGRRNAMLIIIISLSCALTSVLILRNGIGVASAGIFLAIPVATVVRDFIRGRKHK